MWASCSGYTMENQKTCPLSVFVQRPRGQSIHQNEGARTGGRRDSVVEELSGGCPS